MKRLLLALAIAAAPVSSYAACDKVCQQKCQGPYYNICVAQWSRINAIMKREAYKCEFKVGPSVQVSEITREYLDQVCQ